MIKHKSTETNKKLNICTLKKLCRKINKQFSKQGSETVKRSEVKGVGHNRGVHSYPLQGESTKKLIQASKKHNTLAL